MKDFLKTIKLNENTVSTVLSGAAVIMVAILLFNYFKAVNRLPGQTSSSKTEASQEEIDNSYVVNEGDSLWSIAETEYGSGYRWQELYAANKETIADPGVIEAGAKIKLIKQDTTDRANRTNGTYTVVSGDTLWQIAQEQCGDGYTWEAIAKANNLADPSVIHSGNVLKIECK